MKKKKKWHELVRYNTIKYAYDEHANDEFKLIVK